MKCIQHSSRRKIIFKAQAHSKHNFKIFLLVYFFLDCGIRTLNLFFQKVSLVKLFINAVRTNDYPHNKILINYRL